jgi:hypothetical protein
MSELKLFSLFHILKKDIADLSNDSNVKTVNELFKWFFTTLFKCQSKVQSNKVGHSAFQVSVELFRRIRTSRPLWYSLFHQFRQAKFANGGSILSSSQFSILPQLPQKMKLASKVVKIDPKIIFSLPKI